MTETDRLSGRSEWIDLDSVERERTPRQLMELGIRLHLTGLSLSNTVRKLERFGVERSQKAVHDWIQKCDLQPADGAAPNHVALDETVIQIDEQQYWLYAAVDSEQIVAYTALFDDYDHVDRDFSARASREIQCLRGRVSRRWSNPSPGSTPATRAPISRRKTEKSEFCQIYLLRDKRYILILKLFTTKTIHCKSWL